ncbi:MAG: type II and III secretion system protein [Ignavibacteriales bacterium]|nr:type II and III secretion system protein [Ignavibacteriales bacterium]
MPIVNSTVRGHRRRRPLDPAHRQLQPPGHRHHHQDDAPDPPRGRSDAGDRARGLVDRRRRASPASPSSPTATVKNTVRLKDGETNLLAGLLRDEERRSVGGITGLKDIPLLGKPVLRDQEADRADRPRHDHHPPHHPADRDHRGGRQAPVGRSRQPVRRHRRRAAPPARSRPTSGTRRARPGKPGRAGGHRGPARSTSRRPASKRPRDREFRMNVELSSDAGDRQRLARSDLRSPHPQAQGRPRGRRSEADGRQGALLQVHQRRDVHHRLLQPARRTGLQGPRASSPSSSSRRVGPGPGVAGLHQRDGRRPDGPGHPPADGRGQRQHPLDPMVLVLTGPVHGGKTTFLERTVPRWAGLRPGLRRLPQRRRGGRGRAHGPTTSSRSAAAAGIPTCAGRAGPGRRAGRARSSSSQRRSSGPARSSASAGPDGLLVVDEVGPLELAGGGLWPALRDAAARPRAELLVVAREEMRGRPRRRPRSRRRSLRRRYPRAGASGERLERSSRRPGRERR